jgi:hypothetical protein
VLTSQVFGEDGADVPVLTETWLREGREAPELPGYTLALSLPRTKKLQRGGPPSGGIAVYTSEALASAVTVLHHGFQGSFALLRLDGAVGQGEDAYLFACYLPPVTSTGVGVGVGYILCSHMLTIAQAPRSKTQAVHDVAQGVPFQSNAKNNNIVAATAAANQVPHVRTNMHESSVYQSGRDPQPSSSAHRSAQCLTNTARAAGSCCMNASTVASPSLNSPMC